MSRCRNGLAVPSTERIRSEQADKPSPEALEVTVALQRGKIAALEARCALLERLGNAMFMTFDPRNDNEAFGMAQSAWRAAVSKGTPP